MVQVSIQIYFCDRQNNVHVYHHSLSPLHQDVHVLIPSTCEYVTLPHKRDFAVIKGMIEGMGLEMGRLLLILQVGTFSMHESLKSREPLLTVIGGEM